MLYANLLRDFARGEFGDASVEDRRRKIRVRNSKTAGFE
jgi:hypothetical protein